MEDNGHQNYAITAAKRTGRIEQSRRLRELLGAAPGSALNVEFPPHGGHITLECIARHVGGDYLEVMSELVKLLVSSCRVFAN